MLKQPKDPRVPLRERTRWIFCTKKSSTTQKCVSSPCFIHSPVETVFCCLHGTKVACNVSKEYCLQRLALTFRRSVHSWYFFRESFQCSRRVLLSASLCIETEQIGSSIIKTCCVAQFLSISVFYISMRFPTVVWLPIVASARSLFYLTQEDLLVARAG